MLSATSVSVEAIANSKKYSPLVEAFAGSLAPTPQPIYSLVPTELADNVRDYIMDILNAENWTTDAQTAVACSNEAGSSSLLQACAMKAKTMMTEYQDEMRQWNCPLVDLPLPRTRRLVAFHEGKLRSVHHNVFGLPIRMGCRVDGAMAWCDPVMADYAIEPDPRFRSTSFKDVTEGTCVLFESKDLDNGLDFAIPQSCTASVLCMRLENFDTLLHVADGGNEYRTLLTQSHDGRYWFYTTPAISHRQQPRRLVADLLMICAWGPSPLMMLPIFEESGLFTSKAV